MMKILGTFIVGGLAIYGLGAFPEVTVGAIMVLIVGLVVMKGLKALSQEVNS